MQHWYTLYTKPNAERQVSAALAARGIDTFLPTVQIWRARRRRVEDEPLFNCYTFARFDLKTVGISPVAWLSGMRHIVCTDGEPAPVPDDVIAYLQQRVDEMAVQGVARLQPGDRVRITQGPFKDLEAVFERRLSGYERAQILLEALGRLTHCEIPADWLEHA